VVFYFIFLQCFDTVGWVIWPVKPVPDMTYNVFGGTLSLTQSINQSFIFMSSWSELASVSCQMHAESLNIVLAPLSKWNLPFCPICRSYPSLGDAAFYLSLLPMWRHLSAYTRNVFLSTIMYCVGIVMAPVLWYLWIYAGSANANFYFAITLVISTAQVLFVTDLLFAFVRRDYDLLNGCDRKTADGKPLPIILDWVWSC